MAFLKGPPSIEAHVHLRVVLFASGVHQWDRGFLKEGHRLLPNVIFELVGKASGSKIDEASP
jgi:hypothetical protein